MGSGPCCPGGNQDNTVSMPNATAWGLRNGGLIVGNSDRLISHEKVQTGSGAQPAYQMGTRALSPAVQQSELSLSMSRDLQSQPCLHGIDKQSFNVTWFFSSPTFNIEN